MRQATKNCNSISAPIRGEQIRFEITVFARRLSSITRNWIFIVEFYTRHISHFATHEYREPLQRPRTLTHG